MGKSVYSIVLSDDVVRAADELAYRSGTSRSNLINRILAEYLRCETPEQKIRSIFDYIEDTMSGTFKIINQASNSMFSLASPVSFKYRPIAKYLIELLPDGSGKLKVGFRTSSAEFIGYLELFYEFFLQLEKKYLKNVSCFISDGKYIRIFENASGEQISEYIKIFDASLKFFFEHINEANTAMKIIEQNYAKGVRQL